MKIRKNRLSSNTQFLKKGFVYLFLFLITNIGFSPVYQLIAEKLEVTLDAELNTEEEPTENSKKLAELDKEYFTPNIDLLLIHFVINNKRCLHTDANLLPYFPEKDTPPPKGLYSLT